MSAASSPRENLVHRPRGDSLRLALPVGEKESVWDGTVHSAVYNSRSGSKDGPQEGGETMIRQFSKDAVGWGFIVWLIGYALGIMLFVIVPPNLIGWIIMPIGIVVALWILWRKVKGDSFRYYALLAVVWVLIAIVFDYFFLVQAFKPADGYYKLDVYLYYAFTFILPLLVGWRKLATQKQLGA